MSTVSEWIARLDACDPARWPETIDENSGLPGPRANLPLVDAVARQADAAAIDALMAHGSEFTAMCAAAALGRASASPAAAARSERCAMDTRWRVREGVVIGLQLRADIDPDGMRALMAVWIHDEEPLVRRAAVAACCEPRLLRTPEAAAMALAVCAHATDALARTPHAERRSDGVRTLRKTLGYAWSVAVAADPGPGLQTFGRLDDTDPDIAWIVRENRRKKRLTALL